MSSFSCLLDCFSYISSIDRENIIKDLGHDGSEIMNKDLPEPYCRRGFNFLELADLFLYKYCIKTTFIPRNVPFNNCMTQNQILVNEDLTLKYFDRYMYMIAMSNSHAVVCKGRSLIYDPSSNHMLTIDDVIRNHISLLVF